MKLLRHVFLIVGIFIGSVWGKPFSSIVIQNPDQSINQYDWDILNPLLGLALNPVANFHPKASRFNLNIEVHGQVDPENISNIKNIIFDSDYFMQEDMSATVAYAVNGRHGRIFNTYTLQPEYICDIKVEIPIQPLTKQLVYVLNNQANHLTGEVALTKGLLQGLSLNIAYDVQEICWVGYWADFLGEDISTFEELKNNEAFIEYVKQNIREQLLRERPDLIDLPNLLEEEVEKLYEQMKVNNDQPMLS